MKVRCIYNQWSQITSPLLRKNDLASDQDFYIDVGVEYIIYGVTVRDGHIWYYICDNLFSYFPRWKPSFFFEVIDSRLSRHWIYSYKKFDNYLEAYPIIAFPEWAFNHPDFYDRLTDKDEQEVAIFRSYKEKMDLEFPDISISDTAQIGDEKWLICPLCFEAWEKDTKEDALVRCPKCTRTMNNPRYKNEMPHL